MFTGLEPGLAALGQVRNTRPASLPLALLVYSPRFRLASSATGSASAPRPIDAKGINRTLIQIRYKHNKNQNHHKGDSDLCVVCTGLEPVTPSM